MIRTTPSRWLPLISVLMLSSADPALADVAEEEHEIRKDPMGQASSLIKKVFGAL